MSAKTDRIQVERARKAPLLGGASLVALLLSGVAVSAHAAEAGAKAVTEVGEVVVTGSFLASTLESQAQPVESISSADLKERGNPSIMQLVKTLPGSGSTPSEANRFDNNITGFSSVNLRGLGPSRTLTLMNGQRLVEVPAPPANLGGGSDINFIPVNALSRVDVLRDGAAATYGSDAIGGVVNFITRRDLDGFEVEAENAFIKGSEGDRFVAAAFGQQFDRGNLLLTGSYRERSVLTASDRDWGVRDFSATNGAGGWSGNANPGNYQDPVTGAYIFRDNGCQQLGGVLTRGATLNLGGASVPVNPALPETNTSATSCRIQFTPYNSIVNPSETYNLYGEFNTEVTDTLRFHAEAGWMRTMVDNRLSPSNGFSVAFPTPTSLGGTSGSLRTPDARLFVPLNIPARNPGLRDLYTTCAAPLTSAQCALMAGPNGVDASQSAFRPVFYSSDPNNGDPHEYETYDITSWRVSGGFSGQAPFGIDWQTNLTYMNSKRVYHRWEVVPTLVQLAVNGFGSLASDPKSCAPSERTLANAGNNAVGCYYYNPFTNAIAASAVTGAANPYYRGGANPAVLNNPDAVYGMYGDFTNTFTNHMLAADLVLTGSLDMLQLPGGAPAWAAGAQLRHERFVQDYRGLSNIDSFPYSDSVDDGLPVGPFRTGAMAGVGVAANSDVDRKVFAQFAELKVPILDTLEVNFAIRREDYSGTGVTTNPKVSVRWQALDWLAFRGSAGSTFRAPPAGFESPNCAGNLANVLGAFRSVSYCGNPDIKPEKAKTYNFGVIADAGGFRASVDYFKVDFTDQLTGESPTALVNAFFPGGSSAGCTDAALAALKARFTFVDGVCAPQNYLNLKVFNVNGPPTKTDGIDFNASYTRDDFLMESSRWNLGVEGSYLLSYERGDFTLLGAPSVVFSKGRSLADTHNFNDFNVYTKLKGNAYLSVNKDPFTLRWQMAYARGTVADVGTANTIQIPDSTQPAGARLELIGRLKPIIRHDLIGVYQAPWGSTLTLSVLNVLDTDPPFAPSLLGFDPSNADPLGRVIKFNIRHKF
ncbi:MAG: TonB-dependent receptor [Phenylobacterium sp.]|uniref:TonB-dependent receptor domain-containing protein n=1 Tax=Phenylobacterium sp. TaxID=1871053 RepID=UPI0025F54FE3|nr:TonB-dependent receptor [Phenylobacterium sp.]MCA3711913.1 TonB-dependent receptor [Phenylobacterium sp.]MCA3729593.1 TonB-dependent receptor [Phenylobacterium sp.]MCA3751155.1 TonB-dependent receptor [Phenylobacterium sp.]MCA4916473.1 TonB-dependent receptor [Phenylobacterium sp.]MCA6229723.1 TonB-dependent receptor [Phenylobacterium sp.]